MTTAVTRYIGKTDRMDKVAVKVDALDYKDKWGIIKVSVTNYIIANDNSETGTPTVGTVDIRNPQFNADNDNAIVDNATIANKSTTVSVTKDYFFAVNNGVIGPGAFVQPDGTWDLLHLTFKLDDAFDPGVAHYHVTITYTLTYTDLTPSSNPTDTSTLALNVDNKKLSDSSFIQTAASTYSGLNGRVLIQINALDSVVQDIPNDGTDNADVPDSVPLFTVTSMKSPVGFGDNVSIINHPQTKVSGTKTYSKMLMIFAVNGGKIDGNATNSKGSTNMVTFAECRLAKLPEWPCNDITTGTVHFTNSFTSM